MCDPLIGTNYGPLSDCDASYDGGVRVNDHTVFENGVTRVILNWVAMLVERKTLCAERDTLVELNVTTNDTCGSDYHTRAVVDGEVFANLCPRVNVDARFAVCQFRNDTREWRGSN